MVLSARILGFRSLVVVGLAFSAQGVGCRGGQPSVVIPTPIEDTGTGVVDTGPFDADYDGWPARVDCDDTNGSVNPGVEIDARHYCNGIDNDCDGVVEGEEDFDGDGWTYCAHDCDDGNPDRFPGNADPLDGVDQNCDGTDGVGETPTLVLVGQKEHGSLGTVLHSGQVDIHPCDDLLISDCGLTTRVPLGGGGSCGGPAEIHALVGCSGFPASMATYSESASDGIGSILQTFRDGLHPRVLAVGWYNAGAHGVVRVLDFTQDPPQLLQTFDGVSPGDMHTMAVLHAGSHDFAVFNRRDAAGSGPAHAWNLPFPDPMAWGSPDAVWWPPQPSANVAFEVRAFDRYGDGIDELVTHGTQDVADGAVYVLDGPGRLGFPLETWQGDAVFGTNFGSEVFAASGLPGPGDQGLLAGDISYFGTGALYLLPPLGPGSYTLADAPVMFHGEFYLDWFGFSAAVGDVNGDGHADVVIGAPMTSTIDRRSGEPGMVYVFEGPFTEPVYTREQARVFVGTQPGELFGWSVALADLDGDGVQEIFVGAPKHDAGNVFAAGALYRLDL